MSNTSRRNEQRQKLTVPYESMKIRSRRMLLTGALAIAVGIAALVALLHARDFYVVVVSTLAVLCAATLATCHVFVMRRLTVLGVFLLSIPLILGCAGYIARTAKIAQGVEELRSSGVPFVGGIDAYFEATDSYRFIPLKIGLLLSASMTPLYIVHVTTKVLSSTGSPMGVQTPSETTDCLSRTARPSEKRIFRCPCGTKLSATERQSGRQVHCPICKRSLLIPEVAAPTNVRPGSDFAVVNELLW